jgi:hypothetical protein
LHASLPCVSTLTLACFFRSSSIARAMIYDKRHLVGLVIEPQHIWQIRELWKKEGKDCKWALCLGVSLTSSFACPPWTEFVAFRRKVPPAAIMAASMPIRECLDYSRSISPTAVPDTFCPTVRQPTVSVKQATSVLSLEAPSRLSSARPTTCSFPPPQRSSLRAPSPSPRLDLKDRQ